MSALLLLVLGAIPPEAQTHLDNVEKWRADTLQRTEKLVADKTLELKEGHKEYRRKYRRRYRVGKSIPADANPLARKLHYLTSYINKHGPRRIKQLAFAEFWQNPGKHKRIDLAVGGFGWKANMPRNVQPSTAWDFWKVSQVPAEGELIVYDTSKRKDYWISGLDTSTYTDDDFIEPEVFLVCKGTKSYVSVQGAKRTVLHLQAVPLTPHLLEWIKGQIEKPADT